MYKIVRKKELNPTVTQMEILAPLVAKRPCRGSLSSFGWMMKASGSR